MTPDPARIAPTYIPMVPVVIMMSMLGCSSSAPAPATSTNSAPTMITTSQLTGALNSGALKIEIHGLQNELTKGEFGTNFYHTAMVVMRGDSQYTKGMYLLVCSVKRLSGGDPEAPRPVDSTEEVFIRDGVGRMYFHGGYRGRAEKWDPEKVEVRPIGIFSAVTLAGQAVQEN